MQNKILSGLTAEFYAEQISAELTAAFPEFMHIINNSQELLQLIQTMAELRLKYPDFAQNIGSAEPLEFSRSANIGFHCGGAEYITPLSNSFRRQILFSKKHDQALELLIPGQPAKSRAQIKRIRLDFYKKIDRDVNLKSYLQPVWGFIECQRQLNTSLYGENITFDRVNPLGIIIYDYNQPYRGKRIGRDDMFDYQGNMSLEYFKRVWPGYSLTDCHNILENELNTIINGVHSNSIAFSTKSGSTTSSGLHLANFLLSLQGKVIYVMDVETWTEVESPEAAKSLDAVFLQKLEYDLDRMFALLES